MNFKFNSIFLLILLIGVFAILVLSNSKNEDTPKQNLSKQNLSKTINWSGYVWNVETGYGEPGPNFWSDDPENVFVDNQGNLHLKITKHKDGNWYGVTLHTANSIGHGKYTVKMVTNPTTFADNVVAGLFYWKDPDARRSWNELDVEYGRWTRDVPNTIYTVFETASRESQSDRFETDMSDTIYTMVWLPKEVYMETRRSDGSLLGSWTYPGRTETNTGGVYAIDFWIYDHTDNGYKAPDDGNVQELILSSFIYVKEGSE